MNYYAYHDLEVFDYGTRSIMCPTGNHLDKDSVTWKEVLAQISKMPGIVENKPFYLEELEWDGDECKWYSQEADMQALSKMFPSLLFQISCSGEDGERWRTWYQNGASYSADAIFPAFDPDSLAEARED